MYYIIVSRVHTKKKLQFGAILIPARINIIPANLIIYQYGTFGFNVISHFNAKPPK